MIRLPPFSDLVAFDAAARHRTFTLAAQELNVTQPAISRRIGLLEANLGCKLFSRKTKPFQLTTQGQKLFEALRSGLSRIESVVGDLRSGTSERTITLRMSSGFAFFWLTPRLPRLQAAFPDFHLRILSGEESQDASDGDLQVRFGGGQWPGMHARRILGEEVFAVCSPLYLNGRRAALSAADIQHEQLLRLNEDETRWLTWGKWFAALGVPVPARPRAVDFDSFILMTNAILAGQGVGLCWAGLLDTFLNSGALVRLGTQCVTTDNGYFVTYPSGIAPDSPARRVADWLDRAD